MPTNFDHQPHATDDQRRCHDLFRPSLAGSNLTHLYFKVEDQKAFLAHLKSLHIQPMSVDDVVVTIIDPDGRKVMFGTA